MKLQDALQKVEDCEKLLKELQKFEDNRKNIADRDGSQINDQIRLDEIKAEAHRLEGEFVGKLEELNDFLQETYGVDYKYSKRDFNKDLKVSYSKVIDSMKNALR